MDAELAFVLTVLAVVLQVGVLIAFFVLVSNTGKIKRLLETRAYPEGNPGIRRICPYCRENIQPLASICPHCQRESAAWFRRDRFWWRKDPQTGEEFWLSPRTGQWTSGRSSK